ncbi:hypothetical protein NPIL_653921 [Nephila pilipes]|uniref:Uncharacterized protein n=1 Tax=Nephila pilipes TaxID=299642 RepID=A0A8X6NZU4_NEPPI|nr:hypothetical protein NPIL_653921 [Nephila pilipes]
MFHIKIFFHSRFRNERLKPPVFYTFADPVMISFSSWGQIEVRDGEAAPRRNAPHDRDTQGVSCEGQVPRPAAGFMVPSHIILLMTKEFNFISFVSLSLGSRVISRNNLTRAPFIHNHN